jgi:hypothetical protein
MMHIKMRLATNFFVQFVKKWQSFSVLEKSLFAPQPATKPEALKEKNLRPNWTGKEHKRLAGDFGTLEFDCVQMTKTTFEMFLMFNRQRH